MFRLLDWIYSKFPSYPGFWIVCWLTWNALLWYLSSRPPSMDDGPKIPHFDKILHFCYFMAGAFCLANFLYLRSAKTTKWVKVIVITCLVGASIGALDEYHQTMTEGRYGNDLGDWFADTLGSLAGAYYCFLMWKRLSKTRTEKI